jgi:hypothetical protein
MSPRFFTWVFVFASVGAFAVGTINIMRLRVEADTIGSRIQRIERDISLSKKELESSAASATSSSTPSAPAAHRRYAQAPGPRTGGLGPLFPGGRIPDPHAFREPPDDGPRNRLPLLGWAGRTALSMSLPHARRTRYRLLAWAVSLCFLAVITRLVWLHWVDAPRLRAEALQARRVLQEIPCRRGEIRDAQDNLLAISEDVWDIGVDPDSLVKPGA